MSRPAVLVTGGAGFIGSHTCKQLASAGYIPVVFDNLSRGNERSVAWGPLVVGDIRDRDALKRAMETHRPTAVIHFAA
ncbi:NAD-dependent epimerase/dehydratase family protein, partial [Mesorhizobium sp. M7A.T.Ca.US.000.02.1.1]